MAANLVTDLRLDAPDDVYQALVDLHRGLTDEEIRVVDTKLILLLVNHIGDRVVIDSAIAKARERPKAPPNRG